MGITPPTLPTPPPDFAGGEGAPPPTGSGGGAFPEIATINVNPFLSVSDLNAVAKGVFDKVGLGGLAEDLGRALAWALAVALPTIFLVLGSLLDDILNAAAQAMQALDPQKSASFYTLTNSVVGELLGIDTPFEIVNPAAKIEDFIPAMRGVGAGLLGQLEKEMTATQSTPLVAGAEGGQTFAGFLMAFAVREGIWNLAMDFLPEGILEQYRQIGVDMAENLGLGRLARQAFTPLVKTLVGDPMQWYLNAKYRPGRLAIGEAVRAFNRGVITEEVFKREVSYLGFSDEIAAAMTAEHSTQLSTGEIDALFTAGLADQKLALDFLSLLGYSEATGQKVFDAMRAARLYGRANQVLAIITTQFVNGFIDREQFQSVLAQLPIPEDERNFINLGIGEKAEFPRKRISLADARAAVKAGFMDFSEFQLYLHTVGYSDDDVALLTLLELEKINSGAAKKAAGATKAKKGAAPAPTSPPAQAYTPPVDAGAALQEAGVAPPETPPGP